MALRGSSSALYNNLSVLLPPRGPLAFLGSVHGPAVTVLSATGDAAGRAQRQLQARAGGGASLVTQVGPRAAPRPGPSGAGTNRAGSRRAEGRVPTAAGREAVPPAGPPLRFPSRRPGAALPATPRCAGGAQGGRHAVQTALSARRRWGEGARRGRRAEGRSGEPLGRGREPAMSELQGRGDTEHLGLKRAPKDRGVRLQRWEGRSFLKRLPGGDPSQLPPRSTGAGNAAAGSPGEG